MVSMLHVCKLVVLSDMQIDYQDKETLVAVHSFLSDFRPDVLVLNGDIIDMTALSRFRTSLEEKEGLWKQQGELRFELGFLRGLLPKAEMVYVLGNHEQRLADYLADNAPELERVFPSFEEFAGLDNLNIKLVAPYGAGYDWHGVLITHGTKIVQNTAKSNLDTEGSSGISGHTHRMSSYFKTDRSGAHAWFESGCLCYTAAPQSPPPTLPGVRNWQQGFVVGYGRHEQQEGHVEKGWNLYPVHITDHRFIWEGKCYSPSTSS